MPRTVLYHPHFAGDVQEAADWYFQQSASLGVALLSYIVALLSHIEVRLREVIEQPERFAKHAAGCKHSKIAKFPYVLLFNATDQVVLALVHVARSDEKWRERIN